MNEEKTMEIVFVCMGNTCRSPMAEALLRSEIKRRRIENVTVSSAGLKGGGAPMNENTAKTLLNKGLELSNFSSKLIDERTFSATTVIGLTERICEELKKIRDFGFEVGKLTKKRDNIFSFKELVGYDIPDPYGQGEEAYERAYKQLEGGMSAIVERFLVKTEDEKPMETQKIEPTETKPKTPRKPKTAAKTPTGKKNTATKKTAAKKTGTAKKTTAKKKTTKKPAAKTTTKRKSAAKTTKQTPKKSTKTTQKTAAKQTTKNNVK